MNNIKLLVDFIIVVGITVNIIILYSLFYKHKAKHQLKYKLLIAIFTILLFTMVASYGIFHKIKMLQYFAIFSAGATYLLGPLIFLYFKSLVTKDNLFSKKNLKHFIPFFFFFSIITLPVLISVVKKKYIFYYLVFLNENTYVANIIEIGFMLFYLAISLHLFYRIKSSLKNVFSTLEYKNVQWIEVLVYGLIICSLIQLVLIVLEITIGSSEYLDFIQVFTYVSLVCYLGYFGLNQPQIDSSLENNFKRNNTSERRKYMNNNEINEVNSKIKTLFKSEKPYLNEDLTLNNLAIILSTSDKKLSYFLNNHLQVNFHDFINKYRVEAFKEKIKNKENVNFSLLGIAYESGFKSKSSFNRIFKKETGLSPSAYVNSIKT